MKNEFHRISFFIYGIIHFSLVYTVYHKDTKICG